MYIHNTEKNTTACPCQKNKDLNHYNIFYIVLGLTACSDKWQHSLILSYNSSLYPYKWHLLISSLIISYYKT